MTDDKEKCINCHVFDTIYGYCGENGAPYCEACFLIHVPTCIKCLEEQEG